MKNVEILVLDLVALVLDVWSRITYQYVIVLKGIPEIRLRIAICYQYVSKISSYICALVYIASCKNHSRIEVETNSSKAEGFIDLESFTIFKTVVSI